VLTATLNPFYDTQQDANNKEGNRDEDCCLLKREIFFTSLSMFQRSLLPPSSVFCSWRLRQQVPSKLRQSYTRLHTVTYQKTVSSKSPPRVDLNLKDTFIDDFRVSRPFDADADLVLWVMAPCRGVSLHLSSQNRINIIIDWFCFEISPPKYQNLKYITCVYRPTRRKATRISWFLAFHQLLKSTAVTLWLCLSVHELAEVQRTRR
jgi:hypothetical protein